MSPLPLLSQPPALVPPPPEQSPPLEPLLLPLPLQVLLPPSLHQRLSAHQLPLPHLTHCLSMSWRSLLYSLHFCNHIRDEYT
jgi:hypothetical protein